MEKIYSAPRGINVGQQQFCPGCSHPIANKIIADVLDKNDWIKDTIAIMPVGCALMTGGYLELDNIQSAHGRAAATAVGAKRMRPDKLVFTYQGDGDAASIGFSETFFAANRGDPITVIMINNQIYGMTGGQISPTTLVGQHTVTSLPQGRIPEKDGYPVHMAEIIAELKAPAFVGRFSLHTPKNILEAERAIEKAFKLQIEKNKYSFIEILSACPTNWGVAPNMTPKYIEEMVIPEFPLGVFKDEED